LHKEIEYIAKAMHEAIWTPERLKVEMGNLLKKKKMIVVSNREPYMHIHEGKKIKCIVPASGLITAMEPVLKACSGLWIASGTGHFVILLMHVRCSEMMIGIITKKLITILLKPYWMKQKMKNNLLF
jgi:trehalose-6-phosphate synthase